MKLSAETIDTQLPGPLTFYLRTGTLTENHIRQLVRLEDIQGGHILKHVDECGFTDCKIGTPSEAKLLLMAIRPEEAIVTWGANETQVEACRALIGYVSEHNGRPPQWVVSGFWWASLASARKMEVGELSHALDAWRKRYCSARLWWSIHGSKPLDKATVDQYREECGGDLVRDHWGYYADLKRSSSLNLDEDAPENKEVFQACLSMVLSMGQVAPSRVQQEAMGESTWSSEGVGGTR